MFEITGNQGLATIVIMGIIEISFVSMIIFGLSKIII